ncbi:MAG: hypothetical protein LBS53_09445 [Synergistaceae bacterium]|nr:hypothetical protein [Synergistaceae bacterium]
MTPNTDNGIPNAIAAMQGATLVNDIEMEKVGDNQSALTLKDFLVNHTTT